MYFLHREIDTRSVARIVGFSSAALRLTEADIVMFWYLRIRNRVSTALYEQLIHQHLTTLVLEAL